MGNVNGEWIIFGVKASNPGCIHSSDEAIDYVNKIGFLPLFANSVPGFSLEEHTVARYWWSDNEEKDPWQWRVAIAASEKVAYGKFFAGKAGFISLEWFPYFANYRRDGYDFDSLWEDGLAKRREKQIMDCFADRDSYFSYELKSKVAHSSKEKNAFEPVINELQRKTYLVTRDFRQKLNKSGEPYGWHIAVYSPPEAIWGYDAVTSAYKEEPEVSRQRIYDRIREVCSGADITDEMIKKIV